MTRPSPAQPRALEPDQIKSCCSAAYEQDWVSALLGPSFHPGGEDLTRQLAVQLQLMPGMRVLDVACGNGTSDILLAREFGVRVVGLDRSPALLEAATRSARQSGLGARVQFVRGDGESIPLDSGSVDAVLCECALCTFPDKPAATAEMSRVLAPGGRLGITDVTLEHDRLDAELSTMLGWIACLAGALSEAGYAQLLSDAGLNPESYGDHSSALRQLLDRLAPRLKALAALRIPALQNIDARQVGEWFDRGYRAIEQGVAGYALLVAMKPPLATPGRDGTTAHLEASDDLPLSHARRD